jgi:regulator of RNase E activity RraA
MNLPLLPEQLEAIRRLDSCTVANAIETFQTRLRNEGFANASVRCMFPNLPPMLGYAVTVKMRCSSPPAEGGSYLDRTDWWNYILSIPAPRVVVVQDVDPHPGLGSLLGEVHANILLALGCVGAFTNGSVRDIPAVAATSFHFFAASVAVSHAYAHIVEIGGPVEIAGLKVQPGELLHGDVHGVLQVPPEIAADIPAAAVKIMNKERKLIALCRSREFSLEKLRAAVSGTP